MAVKAMNFLSPSRLLMMVLRAQSPYFETFSSGGTYKMGDNMTFFNEQLRLQLRKYTLDMEVCFTELMASAEQGRSLVMWWTIAHSQKLMDAFGTAIHFLIFDDTELSRHLVRILYDDVLSMCTFLATKPDASVLHILRLILQVFERNSFSKRMNTLERPTNFRTFYSLCSGSLTRFHPAIIHQMWGFNTSDFFVPCYDDLDRTEHFRVHHDSVGMAQELKYASYSRLKTISLHTRQHEFQAIPVEFAIDIWATHAYLAGLYELTPEQRNRLMLDDKQPDWKKTMALKRKEVPDLSMAVPQNEFDHLSAEELEQRKQKFLAG